MNGCLKCFFVMLILVFCCFLAVKIAQSIGVEHASSAEESAVLEKLHSASAREVLDSYFWAINHHSIKVLNACCPRSKDSSFFNGIKREKVLSVEELPNEANVNVREFSVRFLYEEKPFVESITMKDGDIYEWTFVLMRKGPSSPWVIVSYGMC